MDRRNFSRALAFATFAAVPAASLKSTFSQERPRSKAPEAGALQVGMLLYPELTLIDLIGPQTVLAARSDIHLIWKTKDLIYSDRGIGIKPNATLDDCPRDLDVLFVPGGPGMVPVMRDKPVLDFLADRGQRARYVTSVCTGALVLGAAGLLKGYRATTHWAARDVLPVFGAEPVKQRVVVDRNRITGGGVTAGLDFGYVLLAALRGEKAAKVMQLLMEYDPQPPFNAGSPENAGPEITALALNTLAPLQKETRATIASIMKG